MQKEKNTFSRGSFEEFIFGLLTIFSDCDQRCEQIHEVVVKLAQAEGGFCLLAEGITFKTVSQFQHTPAQHFMSLCPTLFPILVKYTLQICCAMVSNLSLSLAHTHTDKNSHTHRVTSLGLSLPFIHRQPSAVRFIRSDTIAKCLTAFCQQTATL